MRLQKLCPTTKTDAVKENAEISSFRRRTFRSVSETAMATQVGQTAIAIIFKKATNGAAQIAIVTPAMVRMRPCAW